MLKWLEILLIRSSFSKYFVLNEKREQNDIKTALIAEMSGTSTLSMFDFNHVIIVNFYLSEYTN